MTATQVLEDLGGVEEKKITSIETVISYILQSIDVGFKNKYILDIDFDKSIELA